MSAAVEKGKVKAVAVKDQRERSLLQAPDLPSSPAFGARGQMTSAKLYFKLLISLVLL